MIRIGILTHNALAHTERCLRTLREHTAAPWRAVVLDNASSDDTPAWLAALDDPRIRVELSDENRGVGGGRNWLFAELLREAHDDDLLVFLDNDIEVGAGWERPFLDAFASHRRLGVAGRWAFSMIVHDTWRDILVESSADAAPADTVQGCCFWVRAATARAVGGFDESLGRFWHEDDDYCIRALHAGWDVRRVPCAAITHHEHGSGLALRPDRLAGSKRNQRYLARKWREMGAIDEHGLPKRPVPDDTSTLRTLMTARLQRRAPVLRTELQGALEDAARALHHSLHHSTHSATYGATNALSDDELAVRASPAARALLEESARSTDAAEAERARDVTARIARLLDERRCASGLARTAHGAARAFSALCDPAAWDDERWFASYVAAFEDARGRDFYARTESDWRDGQLMHGLRVTGAFARAPRALVVGHPSERIVAALTHVAREVVVCDEGPPTVDLVRGSAQRELGPAELRVVGWPLSDDPAARARFDVVVCPNLGRYARAGATSALLSLLAEWTTPNGWLAAATSVRLTGPADDRWLDPTAFADDRLLASAGLRRVGAFAATVADETLLAAVPADDTRLRPRLARAVGAHRVTLATLLARRVAAVAPNTVTPNTPAVTAMTTVA